MGEHYGGAGRDFKNIVMMTLGTGIGSATILEGRLLRGVHGHAGCLSGTSDCEVRWSPMPLWQRWVRGGRGVRVVDAAGGACVLRWIYAERAGRGGEAWLSRALQTCGSTATEWLVRHANAVCAYGPRNAVSLIHAYDPEILILGVRGVMQGSGPVLSFVQESVNAHTWSTWGKTQVRVAALGNPAALLGAVPLLAEEWHGA